jgi:hypothetical protein
MARGKEAAISIDQKIEKAQQAVIKAKVKYDASVAELKKLLYKRDAVKKDEIMAAIARSGKSYDEIIWFIANDILADE